MSELFEFDLDLEIEKLDLPVANVANPANPDEESPKISNISKISNATSRNLKKPELHKMVGVSVDKGLSEYLEQKANISEIYYNTSIPRLSLIPGNKAYTHPEKILSSKKVQKLLKGIQTKHPAGYIVIDSSPILFSTEPEIFLSSVDSVIMVVRYGKTQRDSLQRALVILDKEKLTGIIFNQVEQNFLTNWFSMASTNDYYHSRKGKIHS